MSSTLRLAVRVWQLFTHYLKLAWLRYRSLGIRGKVPYNLGKSVTVAETLVALAGYLGPACILRRRRFLSICMARRLNNWSSTL
jgi:hypothetical protein